MTDLVRVWIVPVDVPPDTGASCRDVLDDSERARAAAFLSPARPATVHGRARRAPDPGRPRAENAARRVRLDPRRYGKPQLAPPWSALHTSLSHSGDMIAAAISTGRPVGVDIQHLVPGLDTAGLSARFFPPDEAGYVAAGRTRAHGRTGSRTCGPARRPSSKRPTAACGPNLKIAVHSCDVVRCAEPAGSHRVADVTAPKGFRAVVALTGAAPFACGCRLAGREHSLIMARTAGLVPQRRPACRRIASSRSAMLGEGSSECSRERRGRAMTALAEKDPPDLNRRPERQPAGRPRPARQPRRRPPAGLPVGGPGFLRALGWASATSPTDAWAVGDQCPTCNDSKTLILHWNGTSWPRQPTPNPGPFNLLNAGPPSTAYAWAVGLTATRVSNGRHGHPALERHRLAAGQEPEPGRRDNETGAASHHVGEPTPGRSAGPRRARHVGDLPDADPALERLVLVAGGQPQLRDGRPASRWQASAPTRPRTPGRSGHLHHERVHRCRTRCCCTGTAPPGRRCPARTSGRAVSSRSRSAPTRLRTPGRPGATAPRARAPCRTRCCCTLGRAPPGREVAQPGARPAEQQPERRDRPVAHRRLGDGSLLCPAVRGPCRQPDPAAGTAQHLGKGARPGPREDR